MSLVTRCRACGTMFRVVQDQLRISDGWVRCGRCDTVFDALDIARPTSRRSRATQAAAASPPTDGADDPWTRAIDIDAAAGTRRAEVASAWSSRRADACIDGVSASRPAATPPPALAAAAATPACRRDVPDPATRRRPCRRCRCRAAATQRPPALPRSRSAAAAAARPSFVRRRRARCALAQPGDARRADRQLAHPAADAGWPQVALPPARPAGGAARRSRPTGWAAPARAGAARSHAPRGIDDLVIEHSALARVPDRAGCAAADAAHRATAPASRWRCRRSS